MTVMILDVYLAIKLKNTIPIILTFRPVAPWVAAIGEHMFKCCCLFSSGFFRHLKGERIIVHIHPRINKLKKTYIGFIGTIGMLMVPMDELADQPSSRCTICNGADG